MHKLREKYKEFFGEKGYIGFDTEPGWDDLLDRLFSSIREEVAKGASQPKVLQIKEKFGTLRFYIFGGNDTISELIRNAEIESACTCEVCGKKGKLCVRNGWDKTLCPIHAEEKNYE
jgi:hypothetical protein